jgi:hypothetical protein
MGNTPLVSSPWILSFQNFQNIYFIFVIPFPPSLGRSVGRGIRKVEEDVQEAIPESMGVEWV